MRGKGLRSSPGVSTEQPCDPGQIFPSRPMVLPEGGHCWAETLSKSPNMLSLKGAIVRDVVAVG